MIVYRFLSNPSFLWYWVEDFEERLKTIHPGTEIYDVFATSHIPSIKYMMDMADEFGLNAYGSLAVAYVAVIEAYEWTSETVNHPKKRGHFSMVDDYEVIVKRGIVKELLPYEVFIENYGKVK